MSHLSARFVSDCLLSRLFLRHFDDPVDSALRLDRHIRSIRLPFNFYEQLRELEFPAQPGLPTGVDSFVYYFVPRSGWGSANAFPENPVHPDFVYSADGVGLNLGCPVRLLRALDALARLSAKDQMDVRKGLENPPQHLATVEELLWLNAWSSPSEVRRAGRLTGASGDVDWALKSKGFPILLEAKFRPSDWPRHTDNGTFVPMLGSFLGKAAHKFPDPPGDDALHLVAITAFENMTVDIVHVIGGELEQCPQIHGVVFKTLAQMTHLLSIEPRVWTIVANLLARPHARDFPTNYSVQFDIGQRDARLAQSVNKPDVRKSRVLCDGLQPRVDSPILVPEPGAYRLKIVSRGPDGEPRFESIPKWAWAQDQPPS
jgi:hypothetical protein